MVVDEQRQRELEEAQARSPRHNDDGGFISDAYDSVDDLKNVDSTFNRGRGEKFVRDKLGLNKSDEPNSENGSKKVNQREDGTLKNPNEDEYGRLRPGIRDEVMRNADGTRANAGDYYKNYDENLAAFREKHPEWNTQGENPETPDAETPEGAPEPGTPAGETPPAGEAVSGGAEGIQEGANGAEQAANAGGKVVGAGEKAADAGSKAVGAGEKVAELGGQAANAGAKAVEGAEAIGEGAVAAAEGAEIAAAPETLGVSLAAVAATEVAKNAPKVAKTAIKIGKEGVKIKEGVESADRLAKKGVKWLACCAIIAIIPIAYTMYVVEKLYQLNPAVWAVKAIKSLLKNSTSSGALVFDDPASQKAIDENQISEGSLRIMTDISKQYKVTIHYKGSPSPATGKENEPYEFDITSAGEIKCTDVTSNKKIEPPTKISLEYDFNWPSVVAPGTENYLCAVGYYPKLESPITSLGSSLYGPGEFALRDIATYGPQAAQQQIYEVGELILRKSAENSEKESDFPVSKILVPPLYFDSNLKTGMSGIGETLTRRAKEIFPDLSPNEIIKKDTNTKGVHIGFD